MIPIHISGMKNLKGQQDLNAILDSINRNIDNLQWEVTQQDYYRLKKRMWLERGSNILIDKQPQQEIQVVGSINKKPIYVGIIDTKGFLKVSEDFVIKEMKSNKIYSAEIGEAEIDFAPLPGEGSTTDYVWYPNRYEVYKITDLPMQEVDQIETTIPGLETTVKNIEVPYEGLYRKTIPFEGIEEYTFISYPSFTIGQDPTVHYALDYIITMSAQEPIVANVTPIRLNTAFYCYSPYQDYAICEMYDKPTPLSRIYRSFKMLSYKKFTSFDEFYAAITDNQIMIIDWKWVHDNIVKGCKYNKVILKKQKVDVSLYSKSFAGNVDIDVMYRT